MSFIPALTVSLKHSDSLVYMKMLKTPKEEDEMTNKKLCELLNFFS